MQEIGTLAELDVKPGDVVELVSRQIPGDGWAYPEIGDQRTISVDDGWHGVDLKYIGELQGTFRIVSRAIPAEPAPEIEWGEWGPMLSDDIAADRQMQVINGKAQWRYPVPKQPVVETVSVEGWLEFGKLWIGSKAPGANHRITFDVIDGKPDWSTLRGEDLS